MAYIGSGPTRFNTADDLTVTDDAEIKGDLVVDGTSDINGGTIDSTTIGGSTPAAGSFTTVTGSGDMNIDSGTLFVDASADSVGIGNTDPSAGQLVLTKSSDGGFGGSLVLENSNASDTDKVIIAMRPNGSATTAVGSFGENRIISEYDSGSTNGASNLQFWTHQGVGTVEEAMRIDSSGNLLVGTTDDLPGFSNTDDGISLREGSHILASRTNGSPAFFNLNGNDGPIVDFRKDGSSVGSIGVRSGLITIGQGDTGLNFNAAEDAIYPGDIDGLSGRDNAIDLGYSSFRFDDIYATNGTIQTSDRNEKQDIEELSEAEQRVAVACKSLMRKFRWKSAVEEKGDDARIHFGIIAQDLQAAFEAEGLDASRYAMFCFNTWWEHEVEVPAVEAVEAQDAVYDEEGSLVSEAVEAVEAKEAYTRTDTYSTEEEAPEGAVKKSRMGVRYSELLAFIIAAL